MSDVTIYAIDFGTSNSLLAAAGRSGAREPIPLDSCAREPTILRSILFCSEDARWSFGLEALGNFIAGGTRGRFFRSMKRFLPIASLSETRLGTRVIRFEELIGVFLRTMRERADRHYGTRVRRVLLGRPARFSEDPMADALAQERLDRAARFAGFDEIHFCPEPVAAAYDFKSKVARDVTILVADLGGGTSDFTVARLSSGELREVLAIGGVPLAGDALDSALMRRKIAAHFGSEVTYKAPFGGNVLSMPCALIEHICSPAEVCLLERRDVMRLLRDIKSGAHGAGDKERMDRLLTLVDDALGFQVFEAIEATKRALSDAAVAQFQFEYPGIDVREEVRRDAFERYAEPVMRRVLDCLEGTLAQAGVRADDVDVVCATGGTARVPAIADALALRFGAAKLHRLSSFHAVVRGLAERAVALA
jgi:hypothetical chaperone protein